MKRVHTHGLINRNKPLNFSFDGKAYQGFAGDTLASALLANGQRIMGRSFKYHRPRSVWGAWLDDPNAIFDISLNGFHQPNCPAATTYLEEGMQARAVNAMPSAQSDIKGLLDKFSRFMPAGFYYKTVIWPTGTFLKILFAKWRGWAVWKTTPKRDIYPRNTTIVAMCW